MKKIIFAVLCTMFVAALSLNPTMAADRKPLKGEELFTRTNLTTKGRTVHFHNLSKVKGFIPVGSAVTVKRAGTSTISFVLNKDGKTYTLRAPSIDYDKYFVKEINEIGLASMSSEVRENIKNMSVAPGMTKEEVYISRGCPAFIGWGQKSWFSTLEQVMTSNTWYYNKGTGEVEMLVKFRDNIVTDVETDKKKLKR